MSFAFFFPGQGSQSLGMMNGFAEQAIVKATFDEASAVLGQDLWAMINGEDAELIGQTVNTQPIMLAAGIATYRAYLEAGGKIPSVVAGHSLGEYTALVAAGALDFSDAVKLVRLRAELMQSAVPQGVGAMAAILGLEDEQVKAICAEAAQGEVVEAVNFNSPGQVVIAGNTAAVDAPWLPPKSRSQTRPAAARFRSLTLQPHEACSGKLAEALKDITIKQPQIRVIHNADVASYDDTDKIKDALVRQLYSPVRWTETVNALVSEGITESAECGPGKVLAGLAKRINKEAACSALTNADQVAAFIEAH